jgi:hypothetical protein
LLVLVACSAFVFWKTIGIGYLLDDYLHVEYLNKAAHGDLSGVLTRMYSRWSYATDGLLAYRPGLTLSFWLDYMAWNGQAFGMHVTNILLSAAVSVLAALATVELSNTLQLRHKYLTGFLAGMLFAVYPLHAEETAWIVDRADGLGSVFALISVIAFLRFARTRKNRTFGISLASFLVSLTAKESMVTLPVVITLLAILVCRNVSWKRVSSYWGVLALFALWRTIAIGQLIGGYGSTGKISFKSVIRTLFDGSTIAKIFFCATEEISTPSALQTLASSSYAAIASCGLFAATKDLRVLRLYLFLVLWSIVTVLPAFQIWHIYPNLIGSRLFYVGSIPLCILLAYCAMGSSVIKTTNRLTLGAGLAAVTVLAGVWAHLLQINLIPWMVAGKQMAGLTKEVQQIAESVPRGQRALIVNIPQDYKGASMLGRPEFLEDLCKPPFYPTDLSSRICTLQRPINGGHEYIYPELFKQVRANSVVAYEWNETEGKLVRMPEQEPDPGVKLEEPVALLLPQNIMRASSGNVAVSQDQVDVRPGRKPTAIWLSTDSVDPTITTQIALKISDPTETLKARKIAPEFLWRESDAQHSLGACFHRGDSYFYLPARQKNWTLSPKIQQIGFSIPATKGIVGLHTIALSNDCSSIEPKIRISIFPKNQNDQGYQLWLTDADSTTQIDIDAKDIPNCTKVMLFITKPWQAFDDLVSDSAPRKELVAYTETLQMTSGSVKLPAEILQQPGVHQVAILPLDEAGKPCGILSEPRSFLIESSGHNK